ncbi:leucyl aminopeptidase family protein [Reinekea sp.]|jgi:leucyl aminopeptidase|uniref:leucyl aminopeptidase family protein n=1 Tax=Reinekea sp. TaxID=1970455 RepID=UPI00398905E2
MNVQQGQTGIALVVVRQDEYPTWLTQQSEQTQRWLNGNHFTAPGMLSIPTTSGDVDFVLIVCPDLDSVWALSSAALELPKNDYVLNAQLPITQQESLTLGWLLGQYQFDRYKTTADRATLCVESEDIINKAVNTAKAVALTRDLVNTPAGDMMPEHLSEAIQNLAVEFSGEFSEWVGDELLEQNYPTIHMVGRASSHAPRLLDLRWGKKEAPLLTLVGKGVCFDSGGLDLKPAAGMRLMKKDMGGAAHVLGLASLIMAFNLPVRLRVLVPAVENAVNGDAFRPGDIVKTRLGLTVEIDNTDAEGRLVLCDALAEASSENPDLIIDFATLTGAARVALGLEVPGFYATDDAFAEQLVHSGANSEDAMWRMPLHQPYADYMKGSISDLVNCSPTPFGGSITAALYLQHFVAEANWIHVDVGAWNDRARPGRPKGGEAMGIRATFAALQARYSR